MANPVRTAQELAEIAVRYNDACTEYNESRMTDAGRAALAGTRAAEALADYTGVRLILSGDPGTLLKAYDKLLPEAPNSNNPNAPYNIDDPAVYKTWGIEPPPKDNDGGTCRPIALPTKSWWERARDWVWPRIDPLTLDLDGDGIETLGVNADNHVLFDHDGDGAKHGTGWVSSDDAMLVLDRNNNGTIDNGRELFGDNTQLANGRFAADGFEALADIDNNGDGNINADDTQFANLRLWRDLNQDGVSQANELFTLSDYNIVSLNVAKVENTTTLANGNQIADLGTFTKADGTHWQHGRCKLA